MNIESLKLAMLCNQANTIYTAGMNRQAADLYEQAAALALQQNQIDLHVHCLRWTGNSYLWSFRHEEAYPHLLHAASYHTHPQAQPADIYCALTDLCLLSIRCRSIAQIREIITQTRVYLERQSLLSWAHRLDRLEAMLCLRLGDYAQAHEIAARGWLGLVAARNGPRYQNGAYLDALFRAAHGLGNRQEMERATELFRGSGEADISTSQVRHLISLGMRYAFEGVTDANRATIRDLAREALHIIQNATSPFEESPEVIRLLLLAGAVDEARQALASKPPPNLADAALLRLDLQLVQMPELAGWCPPFFHRDFQSATPPATHQALANSVAAELDRLLAEAGAHAQTEDTRLGTDVNMRAVRHRKDWLAALNQSVPEAAAA